MIDLAKRCEEALGPDRDLDGAIATEMGEARNYEGDGVYGCKRYTDSLDAAMTLLPPLDDTLRPLSILMGVSENGLRFQVVLKNWRWGAVKSSDRCASYALALCAAALRARSPALSSRHQRGES